MDVLTLRAGDAGLQLVPAAGGMVARYWHERGGTTWDWLRPASPSAFAGEDPYQAAAFPLVPYSNRIRHGRFRFRGRAVGLPLNRPPERHSIHGHGWQRAWRTRVASETEAELEYAHPADAWPWAYRAIQRFTLAPAALTLELSLRNEDDTPMPGGLGWHPYFPRTPETKLTAEVDTVWLTDDEMLPTTRVPPPAVADLAHGVRVDAVALDNGFAGWRRRAVLEWPERGTRLVMTAESPLDFLTVYTPPGRPFLCVEPVSHATDAINLAAAGRSDVGLSVLPPGATLRAAIALSPEVDAR